MQRHRHAPLVNYVRLTGNRGVSGWSAVGGMCEPAYIPTGYKIGEKPRGETVSIPWGSVVFL